METTPSMDISALVDDHAALLQIKAPVVLSVRDTLTQGLAMRIRVAISSTLFSIFTHC